MPDTPIAVITGGAGDIGRAIAAALAPTHHPVLVDRDAAALDRAAAGAGHPVTVLTCDLTDAAARDALVAALADLGPVAALVNNAGGVTADSLATLDADNFRADLALNLEAPVLLFQALRPHFAAGAATVNIGSINGTGVFGHPGYSMAKAALLHFTRLAAVECGPLGLRVNAVLPGTVRTQAWNDRARANPQVLEEAAAPYPLRRIVAPEEVAAAVAYLLSDAAAAVSGVCLPVDAGLSAGQTGLARLFSQSEDYAP
ncbi:SDR family oxidoreductase [Oceanomicrobium pacificus]|uniref:SDR family oxidoreductase n=1 Tax=Oceanomicrobium pacificus TaxID=2692916 RepID=A0A6B0TVD1_9RHOB|nr:SDR family oxidoreductase [Oceanomicrobium pacificus]MXU66719.1 SDR family oxidoreductase [Oceanomicrobium pacificus]